LKPPEPTLIAALERGDEAAWDAFYAAHRRRVFGFALAMCGSRALADEATQETFLAFLRRTDRYDPGRGPVEAWLLGVARNKVLRLLEREPVLVDFDQEPGDESFSAALEAGEIREQVRRAVLALPASYREVVVLCDLNEMSYEEASRVLDCAVGTVRSRLHRARQMLAERLQHRISKGKGCVQ
jgi:RNA polymerase sigma-70 factor (ECF subfamily)